jgi:hypothetical protein
VTATGPTRPEQVVPLFASHRTLRDRRRLPRALASWALDSGGFTELTLHGRWQTTPAADADAVARYAAEVGHLAWAAPQDWMCEPGMLARTGPDRGRPPGPHGRQLLPAAPARPRPAVRPGRARLGRGQLPALRQPLPAGRRRPGRRPASGAGVGLPPQHTSEIAAITRELAAAGLRLHGFGVKLRGLAGYADQLASADSLAWSYAARRRPALPGCTSHKNCANCPRYALAWRARVLAAFEAPRQLHLPLDGAA